MSETYVVFSRTCKNWEEFASATKRVIKRGLTLDEARRMCDEFNERRNSAQVKRGMKYEYTNESYFD